MYGKVQIALSNRFSNSSLCLLRLPNSCYGPVESWIKAWPLRKSPCLRTSSQFEHIKPISGLHLRYQVETSNSCQFGYPSEEAIVQQSDLSAMICALGYWQQ